MSVPTSTTSSVFPDPPKPRFDLPPPLPPADGRYSSFGIIRQLDEAAPSLAALGVESLATSEDTRTNLRTLLELVLERLVHIVDALSKGETPTEFLKPVMVNLMYIVNEYRPHQAREDLVQALKNQVEAKRALVLAVRAHIEEARLELAKALATTQPPSAPTGPAQDLVLDREFEKYLP